MRPVGRHAAMLLSATLGVLPGCGERGENAAPAGPSVAVVPTASSAVVAVQEHRVVVSEIRGKVERKRGDLWVALAVGDGLSSEDIVRTGADAEMKLDLAGTAKVVVDSASEVSIGELTEKVSSVLLKQGRLSADVNAEPGRSLRVEHPESEAVAETGRGDFSVLASKEGQLAVAASEGTVKVSAQGKTVELKADEQSIVLPSEAPTEPQKIPTSLFLKVKRPGAAAKMVTLKGHSSPGSVVSAGGVSTAAGPDGRFSLVVSLKGGAKVVVVQASDVMGRSASQEVEMVARAAPAVSGEVKW